MVDGMGLGSPGIRPYTTGEHLLSQAVPVEKRLRLLPEEAVTWWFILEVTGESSRLMVFRGYPSMKLTVCIYYICIYVNVYVTTNHVGEL